MNIYRNEPQRVTTNPNPNRDTCSFRDTRANTGELMVTSLTFHWQLWHTDRQTHKQRHTDTDRQTHKQRHRQRDRLTVLSCLTSFHLWPGGSAGTLDPLSTHHRHHHQQQQQQHHVTVISDVTSNYDLKNIICPFWLISMTKIPSKYFAHKCSQQTASRMLHNE